MWRIGVVLFDPVFYYEGLKHICLPILKLSKFKCIAEISESEYKKYFFMVLSHIHAHWPWKGK